MVNGHEARSNALHRVHSCVLDIAATTLHLADDPRAARMLPKLETALLFACRDVAAAIDELPPSERPKGWGLGPGSETA